MYVLNTHLPTFLKVSVMKNLLSYLNFTRQLHTSIIQLSTSLVEDKNGLLFKIALNFGRVCMKTQYIFCYQITAIS